MPDLDASLRTPLLHPDVGLRVEMRVLFLTPHPREGASSRYRVLQYLPYLRACGIQCEVSPFLSSSFYRIAYQPGSWPQKIGYFLLSTARRLRDVVRSGRFDVVLIHLEAFPIGPPWMEWMIRTLNVPIVFDLDDAIFLRRSSIASPLLRWLRRPSKIASVLRWSRCVITCNDYLRRYAEQFNPRVHVIPTCVDLRQFQLRPDRSRQALPLIGWIGSPSTAPYLELLKPVLRRLRERRDFIFKIVGSTTAYNVDALQVVLEPWSLERDVEYFQELDIGVYPLPDEAWVLGKTGLKTIQYMAVGVPCVVSDIGRNREIVQDGVNGFLARTEDEWVEKLERLIVYPSLRARFREAGRKVVEERYALDIHIPTLIAVLEGAREI